MDTNGCSTGKIILTDIMESFFLFLVHSVLGFTQVEDIANLRFAPRITGNSHILVMYNVPTPERRVLLGRPDHATSGTVPFSFLLLMVKKSSV